LDREEKYMKVENMVKTKHTYRIISPSAWTGRSSAHLARSKAVEAARHSKHQIPHMISLLDTMAHGK